MSIHLDSCAERETLVVTTRSSVYELVILRGERGDVLLSGGRHFTEFQPALFLGSTAEGGSLEPRTLDIGLRSSATHLRVARSARRENTNPKNALRSL
jgi:hypothetical protein